MIKIKRKPVKLKLKKPVLKSKIIFSKNVAKTFTKLEYYKYQEDYIKTLPQREREKIKYSTPRRPRVSDLISKYKSKIDEMCDGTWYVLNGIYKKNRRAAKEGKAAKNANILGLVANFSVLVTAYKKIRGNKGAMTLAADMCKKHWNLLSEKQKKFIQKSSRTPDGMSREILEITASLLKKGEYPWGTSRRIYIDKPGKPGALRPITIPPFMDRVVQEAIRRVLESVYEPYFEKTNRSFGFRPGKGVHDCIYSLSRSENRGFYTAIEGDIKSAYDKVCRKTLIDLLGKKIKDRKFLNLIRKRLDYTYLDVKTQEYVKEDVGLPQGGIDSPYLWNIYMMEFDEFVISHTTELFDQLNKKVRGTEKKTDKMSPAYAKVRYKKERKKYALKALFQEARGIIIPEKERKKVYNILHIPLTKEPKWDKTSFKLVLKNTVKMIRKLGHNKRNLPYLDPQKNYLRFTYTRYADDWIIIGNFPKMLAEKLKLDYKKFLWDKLKATLAEDKTLITDMRKEPAHFLGFELRARSTRKIGFSSQVVRRLTGKEKIKILKRTAGYDIYAAPDKQRLIDRLHMKGYCTKNGFPREIPWLSTLESFTIIERYNSVLRGFANFYAGFISSERSLHRWLYIIRYSCLKTLAQKYKTTITGIYRRFKAPGLKTVQVDVVHDFGTKKYKKTWRLLTTKEVIQISKYLRLRERIEKTFREIEYNPNYDEIVVYQMNNNNQPRVIHDDYLEKIRWVNLRSSAPLDLPCCICGSTEGVQMHHINHVRKRTYSSIPEEQFWEKIMSLRNRNQVPVCHYHHMHLIHAGRYKGNKLTESSIKLKETRTGYDNRLVHLESFIKPGKEYFGKTLEQKGWREVK